MTEGGAGNGPPGGELRALGNAVATLVFLGHPLTLAGEVLRALGAHGRAAARRALRRVLAWLQAPALRGGWTPPRPLGRYSSRMLLRSMRSAGVLHPQAWPSPTWAQRNLQRWHVLGGGGAVAFALFRWMSFEWKERRSDYFRNRRWLVKQMRGAKTYEEWGDAASRLDILEGRSKHAERRWKKETSLYDRELLEARLAHLRAVREQGDINEMIFTLRADLLRNLGNMASTKLHEYRPGVPGPIHEYIEEVRLQLQYITNYQVLDLSLEEKLAFLQETRHAFGRTAIVLSGGGALGSFHVGVVKALYTNKLLPRVMAGSSAGAVVCAIICSRTEKELDVMLNEDYMWDLSFFSNNSWWSMVKHLLRKGSVHDINHLQRYLRVLIGDLTFQEAYDRTGRILNVSVTATGQKNPSRMLNYLTAPHVVVWSAVAASSSFPGLFNPCHILAKNSKGEFVQYATESGRVTDRMWHDGSISQDLPMKGLSEMFNCNYFIVSQTNPHVIPILSMKKRWPLATTLFISELQHRCKQWLEILPAFLPLQLFFKVYAQDFEGDVTITQSARLTNYLDIFKRALRNSSNTALWRSVRQGQSATWPKLAAIQANCRIESTLDECIETLKNMWRVTQAGKHRLGKGTGRIPSWQNVQYAAALSRENSVGSSLNDHTSDASLDDGTLTSPGHVATSPPMH